MIWQSYGLCEVLDERVKIVKLLLDMPVNVLK